MKRAQHFFEIAAGLVIIGALALGAIVAFRALSGGGGTGAQAGTPPGYPPPQATVPAPEATALEGTRIAETTAILATRIVAATASAPATIPVPLPTLTPLPGGQTCYIDTLNHLSLKLLPNWHYSPPPSPDALGGATVLYNYDPEKVTGSEGDFPPGSLKVQISTGKLEVGQSFDQWVSSLITSYTSSTESTPLRATEPTPYKLGKYEGVSFVFTGNGYSSKEIVLPVNEGRVLIIGLMPADSSALLDGLSILDTLDASGTDSCTATP